MQAISRNTQSVAQDFHNAGGGVKSTPRKKSTDTIDKYAENNNISQLSLLKLLIEAAVQQQKAMSTTNNSPPATSTSVNSTNLPMKRRRRSLNDDKENSDLDSKGIDDGTRTTSDTINNTNKNNNSQANNRNINDIFDKLYNKSNNMFLPTTFTSEESNKSMLEFLQNNKEISISSVRKPMPENKHQRKQTQPRKIAKAEQKTLSEILDKHMMRLVTKKKCCWTCQASGRQDNCHYHTKASLILHQIWRHRSGRFKCRACEKVFGRMYKLTLHKRKCGK
jgi:hypothetical protein